MRDALRGENSPGSPLSIRTAFFRTAVRCRSGMKFNLKSSRVEVGKSEQKSSRLRQIVVSVEVCCSLERQ